jgi:hypothetical protein
LQRVQVETKEKWVEVLIIVVKEMKEEQKIPLLD